jgi:nucleoside-diphosphate-sugar epimerase
MNLPRIVVTGASGFVGRRLLEAVKERAVVFGIGRRSQARCGAPVHPNIRWFQNDIADRESLHATFDTVRAEGGADVLVHLAAHYDFTGEDDPEYWRTNVDGLRNVLEESRDLNLKRFVFSSSLAACDFPPPGSALTETSAPDGRHVYARTKAIGEQMVREYDDAFPTCILRFAALFSDWCEYPPLYKFLETWLSHRWNRRMLGGRGRSAVPYLHVRDAVSCLQVVMERTDAFDPGEILLVSGNGAVSHRQLYLTATHYYFGELEPPISVPRPLVKPGIHLRCLTGRLMGEMPFERPWMADYVDKSLTADATTTHHRLNWHPRARLEILRRLPFLIENFKADPVEWHRRNRAAMKQVRMRSNLKIYSLLARYEPQISEAFTRQLTARGAEDQFPSYRRSDVSELQWNHRLILRHLMNTVRTRERAVFLSYCQDLAERRFQQGFSADEVCGALSILEQLCLDALRRSDEAKEVLPFVHDHITINIRFGIDQIQVTFELLEIERQREKLRR